MGKRSRDSGQFTFDFEAPEKASSAAALAGLEAQLCRAAADILHGESRRRELIAVEMSLLLDEEISRAMLDAMASPARDGHRVHMSRFLALVAVTERHDILDRVLRPIGAALLVGEEVLLARAGHLRAQQQRIHDELKKIERMIAPMERGASGL